MKFISRFRILDRDEIGAASRCVFWVPYDVDKFQLFHGDEDSTTFLMLLRWCSYDF